MKPKIAIVLLSLALVAAACNKSSNSNTDSTSTSGSSDQSSQSTGSSDQQSQAQSGSVEIDMTSSGFSPANVTVKSGTVVVFKNTDTQPHWPASNPHPTHTDLPGFDPRRNIAPGSTYSFTFTQLGTWGFHDHDNATHGGTVTVVQ